MANGFDFNALVQNPLFNFGTGLLAAGLGDPRSLGEGLAQGLQIGRAQQQSALQNQLQREQILQTASQRQQQAQRQQAMQALIDRLTGGATSPAQAAVPVPQVAQAQDPAEVGALGQAAAELGVTAPIVGPSTVPGTALASVGTSAGAPVTAGQPSQSQQMMGLLASAFPEQFGQQLISRMFPQPTQPTGQMRNLAFLTAPRDKGGAGMSFADAVDRVFSPETQINVGEREMDKPLPAGQLKNFRLADNSIPPPGTTMRQLQMAGATVVPRQQTAAEEKRETETVIGMDTLDRLEKTVREGNIEPGFISEGGLSQFIATPLGQVATEASNRLFGTDIGLSEQQANALSLQESLSNQLIAAVRGAAVGPAEQERFERQLPRLTQPAPVFWANVENTRRNLKLLDEKAAQQRSGPRRRLLPETRRARGAQGQNDQPVIVDFKDLPV